MHFESTSRAMSDERISVSLLLPVWNEESSIAQTVSGVSEALTEITCNYEIIVIDDGGRDGTAACVHAISAEHRQVRLAYHESNRGYGAALRSGFAVATCDLIVFADAACQFDATQVDGLTFLSRAYDIVCGYGGSRNEPPLRIVYLGIFTQLLNALRETEMRGVKRGLKLFHRESLLNLTPLAVGNVTDLVRSPTAR
ncbi:MAG: hypothetical protein C0485_10795 [Pirellula sp.]|nr:hypothetical protein [Pirellula sp.]